MSSQPRFSLNGDGSVTAAHHVREVGVGQTRVEVIADVRLAVRRDEGVDRDRDRLVSGGLRAQQHVARHAAIARNVDLEEFRIVARLHRIFERDVRLRRRDHQRARRGGSSCRAGFCRCVRQTMAAHHGHDDRHRELVAEQRRRRIGGSEAAEVVRHDRDAFVGGLVLVFRPLIAGRAFDIPEAAGRDDLLGRRFELAQIDDVDRLDFGRRGVGAEVLERRRRVRCVGVAGCRERGRAQQGGAAGQGCGDRSGRQKVVPSLRHGHPPEEWVRQTPFATVPPRRLPVRF